MRKTSAIAGSALFFIAAPGVVSGLIPWLITHWQSDPLFPGAAYPAVALILAAVAFLLHAFSRFALEGGGTPAPVAPTERLVLGGVYRHVRNPMYVAVITILAAQLLLFPAYGLLVYVTMATVAMIAFVRLYEEPALAERYGEEYDAYRSAVPGWLPRLTPWRGERPAQ